MSNSPFRWPSQEELDESVKPPDKPPTKEESVEKASPMGFFDSCFPVAMFFFMLAALVAKGALSCRKG